MAYPAQVLVDAVSVLLVMENSGRGIAEMDHSHADKYDTVMKAPAGQTTGV